MEYKYYLSLLNHRDKNLYNFIYNQITKCADSFEVDSDVQAINRIIKSIMMDNPEIFWFDGKWKVKKIKQNLKIIPIYKHNYEEKQKISEIIRNNIQTLNFTKTDSKIDIIKNIYDWVLNNVKYHNSSNDQTIEGVFIDKAAVCKGIAKAFQFLMNILQIPSFLIKGTIDGQSSHVWNVVYIDGIFYHVDVTMGYPQFRTMFIKYNRNKHYPCFMVSDRTIYLTHKVYDIPTIRCIHDFNLDEYLIDLFELPSKFKTLGNLKYYDKGSTCTVFSVIGNGGKYALKVINGHSKVNYAKKQFRELEILKELSDCEGIVRMIDYELNQEKNTLYLLMPFYITLSAKRRETNINSAKEVIEIGIQILNILIKCRNRGIYHLDIQPKNIYFDEFGRAMLGDFGEARHESELNCLGKMHGTLSFMAPEVYQSGIYGQASEIYSLGIVLYSLLNGAKLPFSDSSNLQTAINKRLFGTPLTPCTDNVILWSIIKRMCEFDITERYSSYEEPLRKFVDIINNENL